jgi:hypothetical protein
MKYFDYAFRIQFVFLIYSMQLSMYESIYESLTSLKTSPKLLSVILKLNHLLVNSPSKVLPWKLNMNLKTL